MPLTDELGRQVLASLGKAAGSVPDFDPGGLTFEAWLSWIAERQPFETESEYFSNQALFASIQKAIGDVLRDAQTKAEQNLPDWLDQFVDLLHFAEAGVVTLNYDTLLEHAIRGRRYTDSKGYIGDQDVIVGFPNGSGVGQDGYRGFVRRPTFRLHKLHGSIDWYSVPGDLTGTTLERIGFPTGQNGHDRQATIGGRSAFIVPPTSTKSGYFESPKTRYIWQQSLAALQNAERVILIGYSLPVTDAALASLISRGLRESGVTVTVVNPDPGPVVQRLISLGVARGRIEPIDDPDCVSTFVRREARAASERFWGDLQRQFNDRRSAPIIVGWAHSNFAAVLNATPEPMEHSYSGSRTSGPSETSPAPAPHWQRTPTSYQP